MESATLSIITPVYNAGESLMGALGSILCREPSAVEVILVDDGSTDDTAGVMEAFRDSCPFACRILRQENQGVAAARNFGVKAAEGAYLVFLDADDRFEEGALDRLLDAASEDVDIIGWDWNNDTEGKVRRLKQPAYASPEAALKSLMSGTMRWNLWLFAIRRSLVIQHGLGFIPGADMGEDMAFMLKAFALAGRVRGISEPLYRYNASNPASISVQMNERRRNEVTRNLSSAEEFLSSSSYAAMAGDLLPSLKLYIKRPLLISLSKADYQTWYDWFPEVNAFATANKDLPLRLRLLQGAAARRMWWVVRLYNILVYKIILPVIG